MHRWTEIARVGAMNELERKLLFRLTFEPEKLSRNKNFATFEKSEFKRLRRRAAHLRSVLRLLERSSPNDVRFGTQASEGAVEVRFDNVRGGSRLAILPIDEYELLFAHERTRSLLQDFYDAPPSNQLMAS